MLNIFKKMINPERVLALQNVQYAEKLLLEDSVAANSEEVASVSISSLGHFYCLYITGHMSTLVLDNQSIVDSGVSYLRGKMIDGSNNRQLFNDYIPLDLWLSPGRTKSGLSTGVLTDPVSNNLFYPISFQYMFTINSEIQLRVKNDSDTANSYAICFHGIRFPANADRSAVKNI